MTNERLAAFYRRYNGCCNDHRFEDLGEFVAGDVAIDGTWSRCTSPTPGRTAKGSAASWGSGFHLHLLEQLR